MDQSVRQNTPRRTVRSDQEELRRRQLVETTIDALATLGYVGTTLAQIAARAEISPGLVSHYFGDKDGLLDATFRALASRVHDGVVTRLRAAATPEARVQAVIDANLATEEFDQRTGTVWLAFWGQALHAPRLKRVQAVYQRRMLSTLRHALKELMPAQEARNVAQMIAAMIDGIWLRAALSSWTEADSETARAMVGDFFRSRLAAAQQAPAAPAIVPEGPPRRRNFIGGRPVDSAAGCFETIDPATGEVLAVVETAGAGEIEQAVEAAAQGQARWAAMTGAERGRILKRTADILRARNNALAALETHDTGKPIQETSVVDIISGAECLEYFAGRAASLAGEHVDLGPTAFGYTRREPLGIVAGIGAWNYPIQIACWKAAPALACGNAMIFKPAEQTPLTALELAAAFTEAGLPDGVFNVVQGDAETGRLLTRHKSIRKVSLTGEVGTGKAVMKDAADQLKYVTLELGGKSPILVFDDADLDNAVSGALLGNFYSAGEVCSNGTRVFVHRKVKHAFIDRMLRRVARLRIGNPMDPATQIGALISEQHLHRVLAYVARGRKEGAQLLIGGERVTEGALARGAFMSPAVFDGCTDAMAIVREEIFGPVMSVLEFDDEEEAITRANATEYGLSAAVFTADLARAHRTIAKLQAGTCWINSYNITPIELPFGGVKLSGLGRENGSAAIEHYTQLKSVYVAMQPADAPY